MDSLTTFLALAYSSLLAIINPLGATPEFSGAEIEQAVVAALFTVFAAGRQLATDDILAEVASTRPLASRWRSASRTCEIGRTNARVRPTDEGREMTKSPPKPLREAHLFDRINRIQIGVWVVVSIASLFFLPPIFIFVPIVLPVIQVVAGRIARSVYDPTGSRVPSRSAYSGPESLAVRGRFEQAIAAYEAAAVEEPDDPEPWLRISRIEKSDLRRPRHALEALRAARSRAVPGSPTAMLIAREMVELYLGDLNEPARAMPELARLIDGFAATPTGAWAGRQMAELKARVAAGEFDRWITEPGAHRPGPGAPGDDPPDSPPAPDAPESPDAPGPAPSRERPAPDREVPERPAPEREAPGPEGPGAPPLAPGPDGRGLGAH